MLWDENLFTNPKSRDPVGPAWNQKKVSHMAKKFYWVSSRLQVFRKYTLTNFWKESDLE